MNLPPAINFITLENFRIRTENLLKLVLLIDDGTENPKDNISPNVKAQTENPDASWTDLAKQINMLEEDWWNSEIVASWYGPRRKYSIEGSHRVLDHPTKNLIGNTNEVAVQAIPEDRRESTLKNVDISISNSVSPPTDSIPTSGGLFNKTRLGSRRLRMSRISPTSLTQFKEITDDGPDDIVKSQIPVIGELGYRRRDSSYVGLNDE
ncbi:uncharacterized protein I206_102686 [Kwoniella pini CBS 10737]|uniref:Uncharacterized protein n=1 Tax=Kwoniella pini CBS 10737 TaxID=1296096 RepID=A0A1B9I635_9TREE|nr:uncharacterized protein I206_03039 [Kwoniella pini CBS 10737]OCF50977.1 hypothetical protein I206_03039 [Kwoniella pini CBS 10737]